MIAAGIGLSSECGPDELLELLHRALERHELAAGQLLQLSTIADLAEHPALGRLTANLGIPLAVAMPDALKSAGPRCVTRSERSLAAHGVPSVAEASALAALGASARLLGPRIASAHATCALATSSLAEEDR